MMLGKNNNNSNGRFANGYIWSLIILVIVSGILLESALIQAVTGLFRGLWVASSDLFQSFWRGLLQYTGDDPFTLYVYGTNALSLGLYWGMGLTFALMDLTGRPRWVRQYKVQPKTNEPLEMKKFISVIGVVLFNHFFIQIPLAFLGFRMLDRSGNMPPIHTLPTFGKVLYDVVIILLCKEMGFYYSHRLLHHRILYKHIHKIHHEWSSPIAITANYCHPIEHIFSNILPTALGPSVAKSHLSVIWVWTIIQVIRTLNDHSGYHLPGFISPEFHDYHHLKFNECYGSFLNILDFIHGTDKGFRSSVANKRHIISTKLKSLRSQFPDKAQS